MAIGRSVGKIGVDDASEREMINSARYTLGFLDLSMIDCATFFRVEATGVHP